MLLDTNPVFRKIIVPWYDTDRLCGMVIILMLAVFLFALAGVSVAREQVEYHRHIWVPLLLMGLSGWVIVSIVVRLFRRRRR